LETDLRRIPDGSDLVIESGDRPGWFVYLHVANCGLSSWVVAEFVVGERGVGPRNHGRGGLPIEIWMLNRLPYVTSLYRFHG